MGACLETSRWSQTLWKSHLKYSRSARRTIDLGQTKQAQFDALADDVHGLLYSLEPPKARPDAPAWATQLLEQAVALQEWKGLKSRCLRSGFAAGVATEFLLESLLDLTPQQPRPGERHKHRPKRFPVAGDTEEATMRRALRKALTEAGEAVGQAEETVEGLCEALGINGGTAPGEEVPLLELEQVRDLWEKLGKNQMLRKIAQMAGRLQRLARSAKKSKGAARVGTVRGIEMGGDVSRLLPQELASLRLGRLGKLQALARIQGRRALQYAVKGVVPQALGPMIVMLDVSDSMDIPLERLLWSKAIALALLGICREQRRTWCCVTFNSRVQQEVVIEHGQVTDQEALFSLILAGASGGTSFEAPLSRAVELLSTQALKKADLVFVTDGRPNPGYEASPETLQALATLRASDGLSLYAIGIGRDARLDTLKPLATEVMQLTSDPTASEELVAPMLVAVA